MKGIIAGNEPATAKVCAPLSRGTTEQAGVTRQSINNYRNAKTLPDSKPCLPSPRALKVTLDDLLRLSGSTVLPSGFAPIPPLTKIPICYCAAAEEVIHLGVEAVGDAPYAQKAPLAIK